MFKHRLVQYLLFYLFSIPPKGRPAVKFKPYFFEQYPHFSFVNIIRRYNGTNPRELFDLLKLKKKNKKKPHTTTYINIQEIIDICMYK